jgi:assimilatory nitrate reductase catalytic subunit
MFSKWSSPAAAFSIIRELSRGQPCDITGIRDYEHLELSGGIQWPYPETEASSTGATAQTPIQHKTSIEQTTSEPKQHSVERRLFADGKFFTPDGKAVFLFDEPAPLPEKADKEFPFLLLTGRGSSAQWHTGTRTNKSPVLNKLSPPDNFIEINPADAERIGIVSGRRVQVSSRRGKAAAVAVVTGTVAPGQVFMPMHGREVNRLTFPVFDQFSRQPGYKACAVRIIPD